MEPNISFRSISSQFAIEVSEIHTKYKCESSSYFCSEYGRWSQESPIYEMLERLIPNQKTIEIRITKYNIPSISFLHGDFIGFVSCFFDIEANIVIGLEKGYETITTNHYETYIVHQVFFCQWIIFLFVFLNPFIILIQIVCIVKLFEKLNALELWCIIISLFMLYNLSSMCYIACICGIMTWIGCFIRYLQYDMTNRLIAAAMHKLVKNETIKIQDNNVIIL